MWAPAEETFVSTIFLTSVSITHKISSIINFRSKTNGHKIFDLSFPQKHSLN